MLCFPEPYRGRKPISAQYRTVAVAEIDSEYRGPRFLEEPATQLPAGVHRFVQVWRRQYVGKTERSQYFEAIKQACDVAASLRMQALGVRYGR